MRYGLERMVLSQIFKKWNFLGVSAAAMLCSFATIGADFADRNCQILLHYFGEANSSRAERKIQDKLRYGLRLHRASVFVSSQISQLSRVGFVYRDRQYGTPEMGQQDFERGDPITQSLLVPNWWLKFAHQGTQPDVYRINGVEYVQYSALLPVWASPAVEIEFIGFYETKDGHRFFDHNLNPGSHQNHLISVGQSSRIILASHWEANTPARNPLACH